MTSCISDPRALGLQCVDPEDQIIYKEFGDCEGNWIPSAKTENYVCFSPHDFQALVSACKIKQHHQEQFVKSKGPNFQWLANKSGLSKRRYDDRLQ